MQPRRHDFVENEDGAEACCRAAKILEERQRGGEAAGRTLHRFNEDCGERFGREREQDGVGAGDVVVWRYNPFMRDVERPRTAITETERTPVVTACKNKNL